MARVLVIDDDGAVRGVLRGLLEMQGHEVDEAAEGARGVEAYRRYPYDVVLCDIFMDGQDGLRTIRELRAADRAVRVVAMSGGGILLNGDFLQAASLMGACGVLHKPIAGVTLAEAIAKAIEGPG